MDHQGSARPFRPIAPRTMLPGYPGSGQPPTPDDGRMKRASTACKECQRRRTRCSDGDPNGNPCSECRTHNRDCVFDESSDRRRKVSAKRAQEESVYYRAFVEQLLDAIRTSDYPSVQHLINMIRAGASQRDIRAMCAHCLNRDPLPEPPDQYHRENSMVSGVMENDAMGDFFNPQ